MAAAPVLFSPEALAFFFENGDAMALSNRTRLRLQVEGIVVPIDFQDFDSDGLDAIFANLAKPPKIQAIRAQDRAAGHLMEVMSFEVSAKAVISLSVCTCTHVRIGTVRMFMAFFFRWPSLFFPDFFCDFVGWRGFRVCMYACAHVFPPYFSLIPIDTFVGIVLMMEPILKKEHHHPQKEHHHGIADRRV